MAGKGPPKTPTEVLRKRGSWLAKTRPDEPGVDALCDLPDPPEWVPLDWWREIGKQVLTLNILAPSDLLALSLLADAMQQYQEAKESDAWTRIDRAFNRVLRLIQLFGLTPASRASVKATPTKAKSDDKAKFFRVAG